MTERRAPGFHAGLRAGARARDPGTLVNVSVRLESGRTTAQFSHPDVATYRDGLRSLSGVTAFAIEQLTLSDAGGAVAQRRSDAGTLLTRFGLVSPQAANNEIATTFVVSENYFAVLGVAPVRGRAFDAMSPAELAASPAVLISENYWHDRFAGDPDIVGKVVRLFLASTLRIIPHGISRGRSTARLTECGSVASD